ncbi:MAG: rhomboid family intramembrane serine protease [Planctomycetes bacterium]|nr:rhomboid family intramembrane serine protease [Planctomycetota bacterium]
MGLHDRDYYREDRRGGQIVAAWLHTAVGILITLNVACFILQQAGGQEVTDFLAARPAEVFGAGFWKVLTANFAHSRDVWHIAVNMIFLYFLGGELEAIYGRRDFCVLYLVSGALAILAEVAILHVRGHDHVQVLGASGAVMAVIVVSALFYPHKTVHFLFFVPAPLWLLCGIYIAVDLRGVFDEHSGVANFAHLTGAAVGFAYKQLDLRWERIRSLWGGGPGRARAPREKVIPMPRRREHPQVARGPDKVSQRIDQLLAKIHRSGKESLSEEEWQFLKENSGRYRSST